MRDEAIDNTLAFLHSHLSGFIRFDGDRVAIKWQSSQTALDMLRRRLQR